MIKKIDLCFIHAGRVDLKREICFSRGINVLAGPNGSGKSQFLKALHTCSDCRIQKDEGGKVFYFDSETMNPHVEESDFKGVTGSIIRVRSMFSSHGETMRDVLANIPFSSGDTLLLDEPEGGHDLEWIVKIHQGMKRIVRSGLQIIMASHHPVFWEGARVIELKKNYCAKVKDKFRKYL